MVQFLPSTISAILFLGAVATAQAAPAGSDLPVTTAAVSQGAANAPIGWDDFCSKHSRECDVDDAPRREVILTPSTWRLLVSTNDRVNRMITPTTDQDHWSVLESWDYPTDGRGDCEDYALFKRRLLIEAGLPRQALLITVVSDLKAQGHAVLTVKTDRGDFVLDNQNGRILSWMDTGYRFLKRQSQENPNRWVSLGSATGDTATAAR